MTVSDLLWISEARMLSICGLPRSTFQGWNRAGLGLVDAGGAYGLREVVAISLLVAARDHMGADELVAAWGAFDRSGEADDLVRAVRKAKKGDRFDLVVAPTSGAMLIVRDDEELVRAVRDPGVPTTFAVIDVSGRLRAVRDSFGRFKKKSKRPQKRRPGRPKAEVTQLHSVDSGV
ncbi:MAG TPA: hypothetical protein VGO13_01180 [Solirubrobacterales bacterium]|jgi:hypothetical protein|nr:hypothetical protein [Solirubrobacterales bacterium]